MIGDSLAGGKAEREFTVRWAGAPASLTNGSVAVAAMEYILTPEAYQRLASAPVDSAFDLFMEFWGPKDPSPETSINEALLEYYSRVDSTREKFSDVRIADGFRTDRGKAYVLYGPPVSIRRVLTPGDAPAELWEYPHLAQRLVFEDRARRGEFVLVRIEPLRIEEVPR
jgi:GWxTD domain-containing protein